MTHIDFSEQDLISEEQIDWLFSLMNVRLQKKGGQRYGSCPIARHTHQKGRDRSQGLSVKAKGHGVYNCHGCQIQGTLFELAKKYAEYEGDLRPLEFMQSITEVGYIPSKVYEWDKHKRQGERMLSSAKDAEYVVTEEIFKEKYLPHVHVEYAKSRGITQKELLEWDIGFDLKESRMIFPIRDWMQRFVGVSGRTVLNQDPKWKHYLGTRKDNALYGENKLDPNDTTVYVCEGFMDVLNLRRLGLVNVVGTLGTSVSNQQRKNLCNFFKKVIFVPDFDDEGMGLKFVEEVTVQILIEGRNLQGVGIAGVRQNPEYSFRMPKPIKWENIDYRYRPVDILLGKDPGDFKASDLSVALSHIEWIRLGNGSG